MELNEVKSNVSLVNVRLEKNNVFQTKSHNNHIITPQTLLVGKTMHLIINALYKIN